MSFWSMSFAKLLFDGCCGTASTLCHFIYSFRIYIIIIYLLDISERFSLLFTNNSLKDLSFFINPITWICADFIIKRIIFIVIKIKELSFIFVFFIKIFS